MTIGERIAALRRGHDLSQEALGEALGVSRQAISKWEADASLPEIDKLVALSRMFGVTIGELLGVEEAKPEVQEEREETEPDELSEQQIRMIEEIAARYIDALPKPEPKRTSRRRVILIGVAGALVAAILFGQFTTMRNELASLRNLTNNLQNDVSHISGNVGNQINSITNRVEEVLKAQNELTAEYRCEISWVDIKNESVSIVASAVPKRYVEGMMTEYIVETDGFKEVIPAVADADAMTLKCPLKNEIKVSVRFTSDGVQETQLLEVFEGLVDKTLPDIFFDFSFLLWNEEIDRLAQPPREYDIHTHYYWGFTEASSYYRLTEPQVWLEINGKPLALETTGTVQTEEDSLVDATDREPVGDGAAVAELQNNLRVTLPTLQLKTGDVIQPYLTVKDSFGRTLRVNDSELTVDGDERLAMSTGSSLGTQIIDN